MKTAEKLNKSQFGTHFVQPQSRLKTFLDHHSVLLQALTLRLCRDRNREVLRLRRLVVVVQVHLAMQG